MWRNQCGENGIPADELAIRSAKRAQGRSARPGAIGRGKAVGDHVAAFGGEGEALAEGAFLDEPEASGQGPAALVGNVGVQADAMESERAECLVEDYGDGPGYQAAAFVSSLDPVTELAAARVARSADSPILRAPTVHPGGPRSPPAAAASVAPIKPALMRSAVCQAQLARQPVTDENPQAEHRDSSEHTRS